MILINGWLNLALTRMKKKNKDVVQQILDLENNSSSDLTKQKLSSLDLQDKNFTGSDCTDASFMMSNLAGCDFSGCNLTGANFLNANLSKVTFEGAQRNGHQIIKFASIVTSGKSAYGFLCQDKDRKIAYINEGNLPESEYKQGNASDFGRMLYQLLING